MSLFTKFIALLICSNYHFIYSELSLFTSQNLDLLSKLLLVILLSAHESLLHLQLRSKIFFCLYILYCFIIFQVLDEAILAKLAKKIIESLFTLIQSKLRLDRNLNLNITESTSNLKFKTRHFWKSTTNIKKNPAF